MRNGRKENLAMIADDDLFVRKVLSTALSEASQIIEVTDGASVLPIYKEKMPDILFLDIHLPNATGLEILPEILKFDPSAYIIMLSADSIEGNVRQSLTMGARGFMTKPFDKQRVLRHFNNCPTIRYADVSE